MKDVQSNSLHFFLQKSRVFAFSTFENIMSCCTKFEQQVFDVKYLSIIFFSDSTGTIGLSIVPGESQKRIIDL